MAATRAARAAVRIADGDEVGPFVVVATPGHAPDHVALVAGAVCFTGDAILGEGSVFIAPDPGALSGYLAALERLQALDLAVLCPGHGPVVEDPDAKIGEYLAHRLRPRAARVAALDAGRRSVDELLDEVWDDAPAVLRPAAAVTLAAHLDKLEEEGRLPEGVERPKWRVVRMRTSLSHGLGRGAGQRERRAERRVAVPRRGRRCGAACRRCP